MDISTGQIYDVARLKDDERRRFIERLEAKDPDLVEIPDGLNRAARRVLAKRETAHVSLSSGGKLSRFAAQQRKAKRKQAKASRKGHK